MEEKSCNGDACGVKQVRSGETAAPEGEGDERRQPRKKNNKWMKIDRRRRC